MIVIVDVEKTCDNKPRNEYEQFLDEIIEIGAVKFNLNTLTIEDEFQAFIKPRVQSNKILTDYCKNLTGITQEQIDSAHSFETEYNRFAKWFGSYKKNQFASWGNDLKSIQLDCTDNGIECKYLTNWDLKRFYQEIEGIKGIGLDKAMSRSNLEFQGNRHRALDDAKNTAYILREVLKK